MELRVQLPNGMSGLQKNCGDGTYPREIRASDGKRCPALMLVAGIAAVLQGSILFSG